MKKNVSHLERLMKWNETPSSQYEEYLHGIKFVRAELGIDDDEVPTTTWEAGVLYRKLLKRTPRVTTDQLIEISELKRELGAEFTNTEIVSEGQAQVIINYLKKEKRSFTLFGGRDEFETESNKVLFKWVYILMFVGLLLGFIPTLGSGLIFIGFCSLFVGVGLMILGSIWRLEALKNAALILLIPTPVGVGAGLASMLASMLT